MATTATTTTTTTTKPASDEYIKKMYASNLDAQKAQLQQNYDQNMAELDTEQKQAQQQTQQNLNRTYVEAAKAAKNYGEVQNAYGLTSGAMAQAKLAQDNTLQQDLTALRGIQMNADADIERRRSLYAKEYANQIAEAQSKNDMAMAEALYQDAAQKEQQLLEMQKEIATIFANKKNDYSYFQKLYGLTDEQMAQLMGNPGGGGSSYTPTYSRPQPSTPTLNSSHYSAQQNWITGGLSGTYAFK